MSRRETISEQTRRNARPRQRQVPSSITSLPVCSGSTTSDLVRSVSARFSNSSYPNYPHSHLISIIGIAHYTYYVNLMRSIHSKTGRELVENPGFQPNVAVALQSSAIVICCLSVVCPSVTRVYCDKTTEAIESRDFHTKVVKLEGGPLDWRLKLRRGIFGAVSTKRYKIEHRS